MVKKLWQWIFDPRAWRYAVFGVLTTFLNYAVYLLLLNGLALPAALCNAAAWLIAVLFAFVTNKQFVFCSEDWGWPNVKKELVTFLACRICSGMIETLILLVCVDFLGWDGVLWKALSGVFVVVVNYFGSKFLVFSKKE